ncbi:MAG: hypothetical protein NZ874_08650 [Fimbriimonadales bacterium]|nr:hypothetical protein [Fimbriimonadales bacterium]
MRTRRTHAKANAPLPEFLRPLFWDTAFHTLSPERHQSYICLRIMEHGDLQALRWMVRYYGKVRLRRWLTQRQGRGLSPRTLRFWQYALEIPKRIVDQWLAAQPEPQWPPR